MGELSNRIAVVGASGFVGSYLVAYLRYHSDDVVEMVRDGGGRSDEENVVEIGDITSQNTYEGVFDQIHTVVYTIARTHQTGEDHQKFDAIYKEVNCDAMIRMAKAACSQGVRRFIFLSSVKALGEETNAGSVYSHVSIPAPQGPYGRSKLIAEKELLTLSDARGLEVVIIRPPLIYGPGVKGNLLALIKAAKYKIPLPLKWANKNRRSLVSLENLSSLIRECIVNPAAVNQIFFVKDRKDLSTTDIIRKLSKSEGFNVTLLPCPEWLIRAMFFLVRKSNLSNRIFGDLTVDDTFTKKTLSWSAGVSEVALKSYE
jgi:UDP-glucose 4-epimerase